VTMVSSWKAAETGIVQVPRSCDGSVRAARPLVMSPWATLKLYALVAWSVLIQINGPSFLARGVTKRLDQMWGLLDLNRYPRGQDLAHISAPEAVY
jgi:hypothetical protein